MKLTYGMCSINIIIFHEPSHKILAFCAFHAAFIFFVQVILVIVIIKFPAFHLRVSLNILEAASFDKSVRLYF